MPPSGTNLYGTDGTETSAALLSFTCSYNWEGFQFDFHTVSCRFATTDITRPSSEQVAERLRALDAPERQAEVATEFAELCKARASSA